MDPYDDSVRRMSAPIDAFKNDIAELCRRYGVERLDLFGSGTTEGFDEEASDLDFIVRFADPIRQQSGYADQYLDFAEALEDLFGREVDLVTERSIQNPFFRDSTDASRRVIYDRRRTEAPA